MEPKSPAGKRAFFRRSVLAIALVASMLAIFNFALSQSRAQSADPPVVPPNIPGADIPSAPPADEDEIVITGDSDAEPSTAVSGDLSEQALAALQSGRNIEARELAQRVLRANPNSIEGIALMGMVHARGEGNFPQAYFFLNDAWERYQRTYGRVPDPSGPWEWHQRILGELVDVSANLERYEDQLRYIDLLNEFYQPPIVAARAWPLMKLRRFDEARSVAMQSLNSDRPFEVELAHNAMCATEFEAGNEDASYPWCERAMNLYGADPRIQSAVDFTNFAEAARSVLRLDVAERVLRRSLEANVSAYGNPYIDLTDLLVRQGRLDEAYGALSSVHSYRLSRPPETQEGDRNESRRALLQFLVAYGAYDVALPIGDEAMAFPDRRGHTSRDAEQDELVIALLSSVAHRSMGQIRMEQVLGEPWYKRLLERVKTWGSSLSAWSATRQASRLLNSSRLNLTSSFRIGTSGSAIMPPWLAPEMIQVAGPAAAIAALEAALRIERRERARPYLRAYLGEACYRAGQTERAARLLREAASQLPIEERLLRLRVGLLRSAIQLDGGRLDSEMREAQAEVIRVQPSLYRVVDVPVVVSAMRVPSDAAELLSSSGRFVVGGAEAVLVQADGAICLQLSSGEQLCGQSRRRVESRVRSFLTAVFRARPAYSAAALAALNGAPARERPRDPFGRDQAATP